MRRRTKAREAAMQFLYQVDLRSDDALHGLDEFLDQARAEGLLANDDAKTFCRRIIEGTRNHVAEIDTILRKVARNWGLERMAVVDRNILRMATWEMLYSRDVPAKVAINEAIELGKRYSTANSGAFVNGILDRIRIDKVDAAATPNEAGAESAGQ